MGDTASLLQAHRADPNTMDPETFAALANSSNNVQQESLDVMLGNMQIQNDKPEDSGVSSKEEFSDETSEMKALEKMLEDLLERGNTLLEEMKKFSSLLTKGKNTLVSRYIHDGVKKEIESIEMVGQVYMQKPGVQQRLESTNLPFHEAVWETAKRCEGVIALNKAVHADPTLGWHSTYLTYQTQRDREGRKKMTMIQKPSEKPKQVHIDIVARNGLEWIKVSTVTEKRLLFEMAKLGWRNGEDSDTETPEEEEDKLSLVKTAEDCCVRAKAIRINYRNPTVRFVFTRLQRGHTDEIDDVLAKIAATGAIVQCANEMSSPPTFEEALPRMLTAEFTSFSPVLNIDCTILLALVSDVSHRPGIEAPWVNSAVKKQIDAERGESLLSTLLYPALTGRPLVCTASAAQRMREIVQTIGLDDERRRTEILMGYVDAPSPAQLREEFAKLSQHPVPDALRLPIQVMQGAAFQVVPAGLPAHLYEPVRRGMTALNLSVFAYGWATGCTTITSNGTVAKKIRERVEMNRRRHEERGPDVWVCPVSRSLVGKMKNKTLPQYREYAGHYY